MCRCTLRCAFLHSTQPLRDLTWARLRRFALVSGAVGIAESIPCSTVPMHVSMRLCQKAATIRRTVYGDFALEKTDGKAIRPYSQFMKLRSR